MLTHLVQPYSAVICSCNKYLQCTHLIYAGNIWLGLKHFTHCKIFILLFRVILFDLPLLLFLGLFVFLVQHWEYLCEWKFINVAVSTCTNEYFLSYLYSKHHQKINIVRNTKSSYKSVINILVETEVFVIWSQTVDIVFCNEYYTIYQWSSTSQVVDPFIILLI